MTHSDKSGLSLWEAARAMGVIVPEEVAPTDLYVTVDKVQLHYLDWGNKDAPVAVLLHGGLQTAHSWDFVALSLRDQYRVIALDQRGHGDSDWAPNGDYSPDAHLGDINSFLKVLGLGNVILMGLSMGGRNAYMYAARHPQQVAALVIIDMAPESRREGRKNIQQFTSSFPDEMSSFEEFVQMVHAFNPRRSLEQLRGSLIHTVRQLPNGKWSWKYDKLLRTPGFRIPQFPREYMWDCIRQIQCPTLVVRGEQSDMIDEEIAQRVASAIPLGRPATVPGAGHLVTGDNPAGLVHVVKEFLSSLD